MPLLYEELTSLILKAAFEVSNELGSGFLESVYQDAIGIALSDKGLSYTAQRPLAVFFRGKVVGNYIADLVVENKIIVELKAVSTLLPEHQAQVINYLKATEYEVGLLLNFGRPKLEYKRLEKLIPLMKERKQD